MLPAPTGTANAFATAPNTSAEVRRLSRQEPQVSEWSITERIYLAAAAPQVTAAVLAPSVAPSPAVVTASPGMLELSGELVNGQPRLLELRVNGRPRTDAKVEAYRFHKDGS